MTNELDEQERPLVSSPIAFTLAAVRVLGDAVPHSLKAMSSPRGITEAERTELITAVRAGQHVELEVPAVTYLQQDGNPNRNGLRFKNNQLAKIARSYRGKPALVDHRSWAQSARIGTITASESVTDAATGETSFLMTLRVVKPEAVISVLDGTLDRFSIGWAATGPVVCTVHRTPVFDECSCWPLDTLEVDGETKIVEYEFLSAEGDEVSGVNTPAVAGTKIQEIRMALAAAIAPHKNKEVTMSFPKLAAVLGMTAIAAADEDRAVAAANELASRAMGAETQLALYKERALTAERELATAREENATLSASKTKAEIDAIVDGAYKSGRLAVRRDDKGAQIESKVEADLRRYGKTLGVESLASYVDEMPQIIPVNQRPAAELHADRQERIETAPAHTAHLASVAQQLGLDPAAVAANAAQLAANRSGTFGARAVVAAGPEHTTKER